MNTQISYIKTIRPFQAVILILVSIHTIAQVPQAFKYQAVLRDDSGQLMKNKSLTMRVGIYDNSVEKYLETHDVVTSELGLVHIEVGRGKTVSGSMTAIGWASGEYFLQTEIDAGAGYVNLGRSQLLSVPYALHSKTADQIAGGIVESDPTWTGDADPAGFIGRTGNVGIGTNYPDAMLHIIGKEQGKGNVLFQGDYKSADPGYPPASWEGTRMMWYPDKAAFRAGHVQSNQWNIENIGNFSFASGFSTIASGDYSTAMGYRTIASTEYSASTGYSTKATGMVSTALGYFTTASGSLSTAMGRSTFASGEISTAMGHETTASGMHSTALGYYTTASGTNSIAMGFSTTASEDESTAMGYQTTASGKRSTAMGFSTTASQDRSTAMGYNTLASGYASTAMGDNTIASGDISTSMGYYTTAVSGHETVIGRYNTNYTPVAQNGWNWNDRLFVIGNGLANETRSNALTILKNGRIGLQTITEPSFALHLPNNASDGIGKARATEWTTYSDERLKTNMQPISYGLKEILKLKPVSYFQHDSETAGDLILIRETGKYGIGFAAQEVFPVLPEVVSKPENEKTELWGMSYDKLTPVLVKAIQEQQTEIDELKKIVQQQQAQISALLELNANKTASR